MNTLTNYGLDLVRRFKNEDEGLALTEYLVVLALLVGGLIVAVTLFGTNLSTAWTNWAGWVSATLGQVPS